MSDNGKEAEKEMAKAIFISADCWLCVFDLLSPRQLCLGIALISHRFDYYVDEHFKTRKWTLKYFGIRSKIGENGTKAMEIVNYDVKSLPIPQNQMPRKVIGFNSISIQYIDQNVIAFLRHFCQLFTKCSINLSIDTTSDRISEFILRNIWPMLGKNICGIFLFSKDFHRLRQFVPSFLNDCPSLYVFAIYCDKVFAEFPCDDSAMASDGQVLSKWLFTPHPDDVPKVFMCLVLFDGGTWPSKIEAFKAAFASASSPVNFIVVIWFSQCFAGSVMLFDLTNELTREQLALKSTVHGRRFVLVRCPIARDSNKWAKWEEEAFGWEIYAQWNRIDIRINEEDNIGDGLLDATSGPSDRQQK